MIPEPAEVPYHPRNPREESAWYGMPPERREALNLAWLSWLPAVRATAKRNNRRSER